MKNRILVLVLAVSVALLSAAPSAYARGSGDGGCDTQCRKTTELKLMGVVYGGMVVIALTVGGIYLLLKGDDDKPKLAETLGPDEDQPFRIVPHTDHAERQGLDLEFRLSEASRLGLRAQYERTRTNAEKRDELDYFGGVFYRVSF